MKTHNLSVYETLNLIPKLSDFDHFEYKKDQIIWYIEFNATILKARLEYLNRPYENWNMSEQCSVTTGAGTTYYWNPYDGVGYEESMSPFQMSWGFAKVKAISYLVELEAIIRKGLEYNEYQHEEEKIDATRIYPNIIHALRLAPTLNQ